MACEALEVVGRAVRLHDAGSELTEASVNATEPLLFIGDDGKQYRTTAPDLVRANESLRIEYVGGTIEELPNLDKDGKPLGKAKMVVDATKAGTGLGYTSLGVIGGSDVNEYIQKNGAAPPGQAAFRSAATVGLRWEVPLVGTIINVKPQWLQELSIIVDKDGLANCRGGSRAGSFLSSDRRSRATVGLVHVLRTRIRRDAVTGRHGTAPTPRRAGLGHSRTRHAADDRQVCTARPLWSADQLGP